MTKSLVLSLTTAAFLFTGCAQNMNTTLPKVTEKQEITLSDIDNKEFEKFNISESLEDINKSFLKAIEDKLLIYSPKKIKQAGQIFESINKDIIMKSDTRNIFLKVKKINKLVKEAYVVKLQILDKYKVVQDKINDLKGVFNPEYLNKLHFIEVDLLKTLKEIETVGYDTKIRTAYFMKLKNLYSSYIIDTELSPIKTQIDFIAQNKNFNLAQKSCVVLREDLKNIEVHVSLNPSDKNFRAKELSKLVGKIHFCNNVIRNIQTLDTLTEQYYENYLLENVIKTEIDNSIKEDYIPTHQVNFSEKLLDER